MNKQTHELINVYVESIEELIPETYHAYLTIIGGALLGRFTDIDIYPRKHASFIEEHFKDSILYDNLELDVVTSLSTDEFENNDCLTLTDYIFKPGNGFSTIANESTKIRILNSKGLFLTKLASFNDRVDTGSDYTDLKKIYTKTYNNKLPELVAKTINEFKIEESLNEFLKELINN